MPDELRKPVVPLSIKYLATLHLAGSCLLAPDGLNRFREYLITEATARGMLRADAEKEAAKVTGGLKEADDWAGRVIAGYLTMTEPH